MKTQRFLHRLIAFFLLISFTLLNTSTNLFAQALPGGNFPGHGNHAVNPMQIIDSLSLPEELGSIHESFIPKETKPDQLVIYVQDAHANYDSETNTRKLIEFFQEKYQLPLVLLEGGEGRLDSLFFKSFPDQEAKEKLLNEYLKNGDLQGGEVSSILSEDYDTQYYGIESQALYNENKQVFLEATGKEKEILEQLDAQEQELNEKAKQVLTDKTIKFRDVNKRFQKEDIGLLDYLKSLQELLPDPDGAKVNYPELQKVLTSETNEKSFTGPEFDMAMNQLIQSFKQNILPSLSKDKKLELGTMIQQYQTGRLGHGFLVKRIKELSSETNISVEIPGILNPTVKHAETLSSIKGTKLFDELEQLEEELRNALPQSEAEKKLLQDYKQLGLLKSFAKLEITHKDWQILQGQKEALDPLFKEHVRFYELALKRDEALFNNTLQAMKKEKANIALITTGGFHQEGIKAKLKEQNIPFVLISPKINQIGTKDNYMNAMQENRSFMKYYKTSLWDALAQDYAAKLAASLNERDLTPSLKRWRDQIIQNSIAEGRITQATSYTKYIDALVQALRKQYEKEDPLNPSENPSDKEEKLKQELDKQLNSFLSVYFGKLKIDIHQKLNIFSRGLKNIWETKDFTHQAVQNLLNQMNTVPKSNLAVALALTHPEMTRQEKGGAVKEIMKTVPKGEARQNVIRLAKEIAAQINEGKMTEDQVHAQLAVDAVMGKNPVGELLVRSEVRDMDERKEILNKALDEVAAVKTAEQVGRAELRSLEEIDHGPKVTPSNATSAIKHVKVVVTDPEQGGSENVADMMTIYHGGKGVTLRNGNSDRKASRVEEIVGIPGGQNFTTSREHAEGYAGRVGRVTEPTVYEISIPRSKVQLLGEDKPDAWLKEIEAETPDTFFPGYPGVAGTSTGLSSVDIEYAKKGAKLLAFTDRAPRPKDAPDSTEEVVLPLTYADSVKVEEPPFARAQLRGNTSRSELRQVLFDGRTREFKLLLAAALHASGSRNTIQKVVEIQGPIQTDANRDLLNRILAVTGFKSVDELVAAVNRKATSIPEASFDAVIALADQLGKGRQYREARQTLKDRLKTNEQQPTGQSTVSSPKVGEQQKVNVPLSEPMRKIFRERLKNLEDHRRKIQENNLPDQIMFGDKHGNADDLERVLQAAKQAARDGKKLRIIGHGDAFDRGNQNQRNWRIFQELKGLAEKNPNIQVDLLFGNHDAWVIQVMLLGNQEVFKAWYPQGGAQVLQELGEQGARDLAMWMLANLKLFTIDEWGFLHVHAGIPMDDDGNPLISREQLESLQKEIESIQKALKENPNFIDQPQNRDRLAKFFENANEILWTREDAWLDKLMGERIKIDDQNKAKAFKLLSQLLQEQFPLEHMFLDASRLQKKIEKIWAQQLIQNEELFRQAGIEFEILGGEPEVYKNKLDRFLAQLGVQGIVAGHIHLKKLLNLDNRIFIVDVDEGDGGHLLFNGDGILFNGMARSTLDPIAAKTGILAGIDEEVIRIKEQLGDQVQEEEKTLEMHRALMQTDEVAIQQHVSSKHSDSSISKDLMERFRQAIKVAWGDGLFEMKVRESTTVPGALRVWDFKIMGKNIIALISQDGTAIRGDQVGLLLEQGKVLKIGRQNGNYSFVIDGKSYDVKLVQSGSIAGTVLLERAAPIDDANFKISRTITNNPGNVVVTTESGATSRTTITPLLMVSSRGEALQVLAEIAKMIGFDMNARSEMRVNSLVARSAGGATPARETRADVMKRVSRVWHFLSLGS